jgi:hypothetical protein
MRTSPQNVISCLAGDLLVDGNLIIEAIREDEEILGIFRDAVEDFTEYPALVQVLGRVF